MMKRLMIVIGTALLCQLAYSDILESFARHNDGGYNYWLYSPDTFEGGNASDQVGGDALASPRTDTKSVASADSPNTKPLVIFLHGKSLTGNDMEKVLRYGPIDAIRRGRNIDAYVLAPQNPGGSWNPHKVFNIVDTLINRYPIDTTRIYVIGMSLGGSGTINTVAAYPHRIAAAMAMCGAGQSTNYKSMNEVPLWILHGTADRAVSIKDSERLVKGIKQAGADRMMFTPLSKLNHSILARVFYLPQTYDWLFQHSLTDSARVLNKDYKITVGDVQGAYKEVTSVKNSTLPIVRHHKTTASASTKSDKAQKSSRDNKQQTSAGASYYTVKKGDTLSGIAKRHHTTVGKLCSLNGITAKTTLKIGRKLRLK